MTDVIELTKPTAGRHIRGVISDAQELARRMTAPVHFVFNDIEVTVQPSESADTVLARWEADQESAAKAYREHPDRLKEAAVQPCATPRFRGH